MRVSRVVSVWAVVVFVLVAALSVGAWAVVKRGVDRQDKALLEDEEGQVTQLLQTTLENFQTELRSVAYFTVTSGYSPQVFADQSKPIRTQPTSSLALVDVSGNPPRVVLAEGSDLRKGQPLDPAVAQVAFGGSRELSSSVVRTGERTLLVLSSASTVFPEIVAVEALPVNQAKPTPNRTGPYSHLYVNVYATSRALPGQLILSTFGPGALPKPVASSVLKLGSVTWLIQAAQRTPLAGTYAEASPWITLGVGLLIALALASAVQALARRERHAARVVTERTQELLEAQKLVVRNERLAAVGELATVVGHELRNPLGSAINELFLLRMTLGDSRGEEAKAHITGAERAIYRAARLSEDLTAYMRERDPVFSELDFHSLVAEVLHSTPAPSGIDVVVDGSARFSADRVLMIQVLTNLIVNAYQAMPEGGSVQLGAGNDDHSTLITVQDSGAGFDPETSQRVFDPFFTTKDEGTGLGLAIVRRFVELHGGTISVENVATGGGRVAVHLPTDLTR